MKYMVFVKNNDIKSKTFRQILLKNGRRLL